MKTLLMCLTVTLIATFTSAQNVGFTYQAVALDASKAEGLGRDSRGEILANKSLRIRFSLHEANENGRVVYKETHDTSTDIFGIFRLIVGRGYDVSGTAIDDLMWGEVPYFLEVEIDLGNGFEYLGIEELLGSPYSLNRKKQLLNLQQNVLSLTDGNSVILGDNDNTNELIDSFSLIGTQIQISEAGANRVVDLAGLVNTAKLSEAEIDQYVSNNGYLTTEIDGSASNELQTISRSGTDITLSNNGGTISIADNDSDSQNEIQNLQLNGAILQITNNPSATPLDLSSLVTEAQVDQFTNNNGYLTSESQSLSTDGNPGNVSITNGSTINLNVNDADADPVNEIQDLHLNGTVLSITNNPAATSIDFAPFINNINLTEVEVDAFANNNGYLTSESQDISTDGTAGNISITNGTNLNLNVNDADADPANEIQDLVLTGNILSITNNAAATEIDLSSYRNVFERTNGIISNENGDYETDDFVFGDDNTEWQWDGDLNNLNRSVLFFDRSKAAFRVGRAVGDAWNDSLRGQYSVVLGAGVASGMYSAVLAGGTASGLHAVALGNGVASGNGSIAIGANSQVPASGLNSIAVGYQSTAPGARAVAIGNEVTASGEGSFASGSFAVSSGLHSVSIGSETRSIGSYTFAAGYRTTSSGWGSASFGSNTSASGGGSLVFGDDCRSEGSGAISGGSFSRAIGANSIAIGTNAISLAGGSVAFGLQTASQSPMEFTLGQHNTRYTPTSADFWIPTDRLFVIGNGEYDHARSDALIMLKNGNTTLNGQLTIDADNVNGPGLSYTLPGQRGVNGQVMITDGSGNVNWSNVSAAINETDIDNLVSNNGYLTAEVDGSTTNEIQDLVLTGNTLSITNNPAATQIDLSDYENVFETTNGITSNENGDYANDDFVFGGPDLNSDGGKFFFDKSKFAFRAGYVPNNSSWSDANIGIGSFAAGYNVIASGGTSVAFGTGSQATGDNSFAAGLATIANGPFSFTAGRTNTVNGEYSIALGYASQVSTTATRAVALGSLHQVNGWGGVAIGNWLRSRSFSETVLGFGNTDVPASSENAWVATDRLFVIGNGIPVMFNDLTQPPTRSDALVMLKNGNTTLNGQLTIDADNVNGAGGSYTLPGQRGLNGQTMVTDGNGNVTWATPPSNAFSTNLGLTSNTPGNLAADSFVFGSPALDDDSDPNHDNRFLFDKSNGAFRAGSADDTQWDAQNRGTHSTALGSNNVAPGEFAFAAGRNNLAYSASSVAIGTNNQAEGYNSLAIGRNVATTGTHSMALSLYSAARSYGETTMGIYASDYVPNSTTSFDANDRLFTIGNGLDDSNRSNALVIFKNGDATLLGTLTDASDSRLKRNIKPLRHSLFALTNLQGVHYQWNGRKPQDTLSLQTGLIAQEVEKIFPELVKTDEEGFKSVNYIGLVPHLIEAIKELKAENDQLRSENAKTKASTERRLAVMEAKLMKIEALADNMNR